MKTIEIELQKEKSLLEQIVKEAKERLVTAPEGHLRIMKKRGGVEYYYRNNDNNSSNGRYMRKSEENLAKNIAQRDYDVNLINKAEERIKAIDKFSKIFEDTSLKKLYEKTNQLRREIINAPIISDDEFVKRWQAVEYDGKLFVDDAQEIITEREEVYLEHFGMMDDSGYVDKVLFKLSTYERNGIYLGVNLFVTYETSKTMLNTRALDGLVRKLFCAE